jgi:hypothetical protein
MILPTGDIMQIHLSRPGGGREGPYTLEQIKKDLAAHKYRDTDYWAWHEGLTEWVPLYSLPGISASDDSAPPVVAAPQPKALITPAKPKAAARDAAATPVSAVPARAEPRPALPEARLTPTPAAPAAAGPEPEEVTAPAGSPAISPRDSATRTPAALPEEEPVAVSHQVSSGMSASALEQVFMFTTGDGHSAWQSPTVARMFNEIIGEDLGTLREEVSRDVIARCAVGELLKPDGSVSDAVWRAMAAHRPALVQQARERLYRICVRTFRIEGDAIVALVLFYNKQKL